MTINRDVMLYSLTPHTHVRGKRWSYEAIYPDGRKETLLSVPNYDFEWQHEYVFREPLTIPEGHEDPRHRVVRQLEGEQVESRSDQGRLVGRSDVGRDDVHRAHVQRRHGGAADGGPAVKQGRRQKAEGQTKGSIRAEGEAQRHSIAECLCFALCLFLFVTPIPTFLGDSTPSAVGVGHERAV